MYVFMYVMFICMQVLCKFIYFGLGSRRRRRFQLAKCVCVCVVWREAFIRSLICSLSVYVRVRQSCTHTQTYILTVDNVSVCLFVCKSC